MSSVRLRCSKFDNCVSSYHIILCDNPLAGKPVKVTICHIQIFSLFPTKHDIIQDEELSSHMYRSHLVQ